MLTTITVKTNNALNVANAITAINTTNIGYSIEGEGDTLYIIFEDLTSHQHNVLVEELSLNEIIYTFE